MKVSQAGGVLSVRADSYTLTFAHDRPFVYVDAAAGSRVAELFAFSSVHPLHDRDDTTKIGAWAVAEMADELVVSVRTVSPSTATTAAAAFTSRWPTRAIPA
jgi:hypothetical protein